MSSPANNAVGVGVNVAGVARISRSSITGNSLAGVDNSGGTVESYGDNAIRGNANDNIAVLTPVALH